MTEELTNAIVDLREDDALAMVDRLLEEGTDPVGILDDCKRAMDVIGERFACGEAFIPELIMAGEIMTGDRRQAEAAPGRRARPQPRLGTVVIGTVQGDIHDIGKDIVVTMLDIAGFEVVDLGVDVPVGRGSSRRSASSKPQVVGMSGLLTIAIDAMKTRSSPRSTRRHPTADVKIMVGGAPDHRAGRRYTGADGWGKDAVEAVELAKQWVGGA